MDRVWSAVTDFWRMVESKTKAKVFGGRVLKFSVFVTKTLQCRTPNYDLPHFPVEISDVFGLFGTLGHRLPEYPKISNFRKFNLDHKLGQRTL